MQKTKQPAFVGVTGLPRSGTTLLCRMLGMHPDIHGDGVESPLCGALLGLRRMLSDDIFMLTQLETDFARAYARLHGGMAGLLRGWYGDCDKPVVVDKNPAWLQCIETLLKIVPDAKLIVCLRELGQVYGSIEAQHQQTILLDSIDHFADFDRFGRADVLFARDRIIGAPLAAIQAVPELPKAVRKRLFFMRFEDLMARPEAVMQKLFEWLGVSAYAINTESLAEGAQGCDSLFRMKNMHARHTTIQPPAPHDIPPRIQAQIANAYAWYYRLYYPATASENEQ